MRKKRKKLGVVIPLANEEKTIDTLLNGITSHLTPQDRIFCILDYASSDMTRKKVTAYKKRDKRVRLVWAPEDRNVVDAYFRGYREALDNDCEWILEMDGGMSHDPAEIPLFLEAMEMGYDFAAGSRFVKNGGFSGSFWRKTLSSGGTILTNLVLKTRMHDMTSGFECFTRQALEYVLQQGVQSSAHFFQTEIRVMMHRFRWIEIPIHYHCTCHRVAASSVIESLRILCHLAGKGRNSE